MYGAKTKKLTPVMKQYREAKTAYPDALLFFRLGDFYELFNDDAVVAARELSLTLTSRNKGAEDEVPMAGVPYHSAHGHLAKLVGRGHKVAICEQMGDPTKIKGIVPRKVVRVLTPGLLTDDGQLDARKNNFLCAVDGSEEVGFGLSRLDLSTGELSTCEVSSAALLVAEIARAEPSETLVPAALDSLHGAIQDALATALRRDDALDDESLAKLLDEGVERPLYDDAAAQHGRIALRAAARALRFARHYLPEATLPVRRIGRFDPSSHMHVDETAQRHLELVESAEGTRAGSLLDAVDATVTAAGARLLRRQLLSPLAEVERIRRRHDAVDLFVQNPRSRDELRGVLRTIGDVERLATRASLGEATPRDLGRLGQSLRAAPQAVAIIEAIPQAVELEALDLQVDLCDALADRLARALVDEPPARASDGGLFREGYDEGLDELRRLKQSGSELIAELETRRREETGIGSLKIKFTRAFGWYIEVTRTHLDKVPSSWRRRQSLKAAERYVDDELEDLADRLMGAEERFAEREQELFSALVSHVAGHGEPLTGLARAVAQWDVSAALAEIAQSHDYRRPVVDDGEVLSIREGRHPVVERFVAAGRFVPNDTHLDPGSERLWLVTGPNMAGKSTLMRQVALTVILAQMGSFVPAAEARIGRVDRVLSRVGASDNLARGESTFMVEMRETATILRDATRRSLVILDEIGRGTSTFDGLAIAWAVAEYLHTAVGCRAMFATHYHQLTELAELHEGIANYSVSAREHEGEIVFLHRLTAGAVSRSYGIAVARLAGVPDAVIARAREILGALEGADDATDGPRRSARSDTPQLELFAPPPPEPAGASEAEKQTLATLRELDVSSTTPLEALQLLDRLKASLD